VNPDELVALNKQAYPGLNKSCPLKAGTALTLPPPLTEEEARWLASPPEWLDPCLQLVRKLRASRHASHFQEPVDWRDLGLESYPWIVTSPMDLSTVERNLGAGRYETPDAFARDVQLTLANALVFNPEEDDQIHEV
jgi:hypothetical protein